MSELFNECVNSPFKIKQAKTIKLIEKIRKKVVIAFSGGGDSFFLWNLANSCRTDVFCVYIIKNPETKNLFKKFFPQVKLIFVNFYWKNLTEHRKIKYLILTRIAFLLKGVVLMGHTFDDVVIGSYIKNQRKSHFLGIFSFNKSYMIENILFIRPIINFTRKEILTYMAHNQYFIEDNLFSKKNERSYLMEKMYSEEHFRKYCYRFFINGNNFRKTLEEKVSKNFEICVYSMCLLKEKRKQKPTIVLKNKNKFLNIIDVQVVFRLLFSKGKTFFNFSKEIFLLINNNENFFSIFKNQNKWYTIYFNQKTNCFYLWVGRWNKNILFLKYGE